MARLMNAAFAGALLLLLNLGLAHGATHYYEFNVALVKKSPDCVQKIFPGINGQYPGPDIRVKTDDIVIIKVTNNITTNVAMHWHGLLMRNTQWADGVAQGTQCPITPGTSFTYIFDVIGQKGTFWYHAHIDYLRQSIYGAFIIEPTEPTPWPTPAGEYTLLFNDWYHRTQDDMLHLLETSNGNIAQPDALVINGRGYSNCSYYLGTELGAPNCEIYGDVCNPCDNNSPDCKPTNITVEPGKTYLIRIVAVGIYGMFNVGFEGHKFQLVEVDGRYIKPLTYTSLNILPAQAFTVLLTADQPSDNYLILQLGNFGTPTGGQWRGQGKSAHGRAILHYAGEPEDYTSLIEKDIPDPTTDFDVFAPKQQLDFHALEDAVELKGKEPTRNLVFRWSQVDVNGKLLFAINNISYKFSDTPLLYAEYANIPGVFDTKGFVDIPPPYSAPTKGKNPPGKLATSIIDLKFGSLVEIVLESNVAYPHPWHVHGVDFWVVGHGDGKPYDHTKRAQYAKGIGATWNTVDPPLRNVVSVYNANQTGNWVAIWFFADNPGVWNTHCHLEPHFHLGMQNFLRIAHPSIPEPPPGYPATCGAVKGKAF